MEILTARLPALRGDSSSSRSGSNGGAERLVLKTKTSFVFLQNDEIQWIEAKGPCCLIHCGPETIRVRRGITELQNQLDPLVFARICRSVMINLNHIRLLRPRREGRYQVTMNDGSTLHGSRSFRDCLAEFIDRINKKANI